MGGWRGEPCVFFHTWRLGTSSVNRSKNYQLRSWFVCKSNVSVKGEEAWKQLQPFDFNVPPCFRQHPPSSFPTSPFAFCPHVGEAEPEYSSAKHGQTGISAPVLHGFYLFECYQHRIHWLMAQEINWQPLRAALQLMAAKSCWSRKAQQSANLLGCDGACCRPGIFLTGKETKAAHWGILWAESDSQAGWGKGIVKNPKPGEKIPNV